MRLDAFRELLDIHGSDPRRWPPAERREAEALLGRSAEARGVLEEAARLDALLTRTLSAGTAGEDLRNRILAGIPAQARPAAPPDRTGRRWLEAFTLPWRIGAAGAAGALLFGIYAGASATAPSDTPFLTAPFQTARIDEVIDVADLAYGAGFYEDTLP